MSTNDAREALLTKATWFRFCPSTGEYTGEYCSVRPHDDTNMVPMVHVDAILAALNPADAEGGE